MNIAPQVETAELSDADLDNVAGGHAGVDAGAAAGLYVEAGNVGVAAGAGAGVQVEGVSADVHLHATVC
ncbi:hypothetical protein ACIBAI_03480 [Streptomyces sp. NPDC051041]|uniref:hypothetical protein n=1 Tax=Streptomyces sp. NPDC051041 TaxID=3365640 RepID=UPI0037A6BCC5